MYSVVYSIKQLQEPKKERPCDKLTSILRTQKYCIIDRKTLCIKNEELKNSPGGGGGGIFNK